MSHLNRLFTDHPQSVNETYFEHMGVATSFGSRMILAGFACMAHGILPFLFTKTGSRTIQTLHTEMNEARVRNAPRAAVAE
ncbi:MAG: DUF6356 family protein [Pseudomonadota bacterium]